MKKIKYFLIVSVIPALVFINCAPQMGIKKKEKHKDENSTTVSNDGGDVGLDDGTNVAIPAGALAVGTNVSVTRTDAPSDFAIDGVSSASDAIAIGATDANGNAVEHSVQPMTISLPMSGAGLALLDAVETAEANLCSLLKTGSYGNFVWRYSSLTVDTAKNLVSFPSRFFGTFQLVYCGTNSLGGFKDPNSTVLPGDTTYDIAITIPANFKNLSQARYCGFVIRSECGDEDEECKGENEAFIGSVSVDASIGTEQTLTMALGEQAVIADKNYYVGVTLNSSGDACSFDVGDTMGDGVEWKFNQLFGFEFTSADIIDGLSGSISGDDGPFKTKFDEITFQIGAPNLATTFNAAHAESQVCLEYNNGNNVVAYNVSFDAGNLISGASSIVLPDPVGSSPSPDNSRAKIDIGARCFSFHGDPSQANTANGKPYSIEFPKGGTPLYISPVKMHFGGAFAAAGADDKACLDIKPAGNSSDHVGHIALNADANVDYYLFLPFLAAPHNGSGVPLFDLSVDIVTDHCYEGGGSLNGNILINPIPAPGKELNPNIEVGML